MLKWWILAGGAAAYFLFFRPDQSQADSSDNTGQGGIPEPVTSPVLGPDCVGSTDSMGHWRGIDTSGNCTPFALGGSGGDF